MLIGVPKEIKDNEFRVSLVPQGVKELKAHGHEVIVEKSAGVGSGISDDEYKEAGASIVNASEAWQADIVIKVKEPQEAEFKYFRKGLLLFTFLHLAANRKVAEALVESKVTSVAYETLEYVDEENRRILPILKPMSEVAGRVGVLEGCHYLCKPYGGVGVLAGGIEGVENASIVILGGGHVGENASEVAVGTGADVTMIDISDERLKYYDKKFSGKVKTVKSTAENIENAVKNCDMLVGAVHVPGERTPFLVPKELVAKMKKGSVIVDVAVDQGGSVETTRPTTHSDPVFTYEGVIHYCVSNMPGAVPRTSTFALTKASLPYLLGMANDGLDFITKDPYRKKGINTLDGKVVNEAVAKTLGMEYSDI